jgi:DNA-binding PadR family transcriptional regulator
MFGGYFHGGDPRLAIDPRMRGFGQGALEFWRQRHHHHPPVGHGGDSHGDFDPSAEPDANAHAVADFNFFEEEAEGEEMRGDRHGQGGGFRHARGREGGGFGWDFGGPRGRGFGRPLEQGDLRWLTLDLIAAQPRHGYEIIKEIADALSGHYAPSPGVIYPTLTLLEETGLIAGEAQGAKKLYRLTDEGRAEVASHTADIRAARARLEQAKTRFGGSPAPELMRAMNNLRAALQVRLAKGELSSAALSAITAALDRATGEIERS